MKTEFIRERITALRMQKGISELRMSLELGKSRGFIQGISSGRCLPSLKELFAICEYLGVEPKDFFDEGTKSPGLKTRLNTAAGRLTDGDLTLLVLTAERLADGDPLRA